MQLGTSSKQRGSYLAFAIPTPCGERQERFELLECVNILGWLTTCWDLHASWTVITRQVQLICPLLLQSGAIVRPITDVLLITIKVSGKREMDGRQCSIRTTIALLILQFRWGIWVR